MSNKAWRLSLSILGLNLAGSGAAWATGGCVNSPENPTLILAALGSVAAGYPWLKTKLSTLLGKPNGSPGNPLPD